MKADVSRFTAPHRPVTGQWERVNGSAGEWDRADLFRALTEVQDKENWKRPIPEQTIPVLKLCVTVEAIAYFCGSHSFVRNNGDGTFQIKAPGYYECVGA